MQELVDRTHALREASVREWDTLPMGQILRLRDDLVAMLPVAVKLADTRIKQAHSRAKRGTK